MTDQDDNNSEQDPLDKPFILHFCTPRKVGKKVQKIAFKKIVSKQHLVTFESIFYLGGCIWHWDMVYLVFATNKFPTTSGKVTTFPG